MTNPTPVVVSVPHQWRDLVTLIMHADVKSIMTVGGRDYLFYMVTGRGVDAAFVDPIDGELLVQLHHFDNEADARAWVGQDIALRLGQTQGVQ